MAGLLGLVAATLAAGCGEFPAPEALAVQEAPMSRLDRCPTGNCSGDPTNGKGIYVTDGSSYCIPVPPQHLFCPEHFQNTPDGTVELIGQFLHDTGAPALPGVLALEVRGTWSDETGEYAVGVNTVTMDSQGVVVTVSGDPAPSQVSGPDLLNLRLSFLRDQNEMFELRLQPSTWEKGVALYWVDYFSHVTQSWQHYCSDGTGTAAFLPGMLVDSLSAKIQRVHPNESVTMACRSGAITSCMVWGYHPWEAAPQDENRASFLYGACLQAKRAAYFVASRDYNSYTRNGTPLAVQDRDGIMDVPMLGVEAVWSPNGAVCISPEYRRQPVQGAPALPSLPATLPLPPCGQSLHVAAGEGGLRALLQESEPLATGRVGP
jgi:hypothetical protein